MTRIIDRYIYKEMGPPFLIGVGVFTFFLVIDRIYQLTDLVITKNVPFALVMPLLVYMLPAFLALTLPMALLVTVLLVCGRLAGDLEVAALKASGVSPLRLFRPFLAVGIIITLLISWLTLVVGRGRAAPSSASSSGSSSRAPPPGSRSAHSAPASASS